MKTKRKRKHVSNGRHRLYKTKRYQRGIDQIHRDISTPELKEALLSQKIDIDLPGLGKYYCIECSRYFESNDALVKHRIGKIHKKRVKLLKEVPYSQEEAEASVGIGIKYNTLYNV
ncbi:hypothetical protein PORY_001209 [Pneumocystis oryctolagi]|uniref:Uncharacterized protein n=1 Tax=Pneumocystis oryctolagi TaxID=42067 RepID=A0ACB7CDJ6_9ASCO|nr:hypothetical protein PORY_001209 [Pneumocystis oryctolagi]